MRRWFRDPAGPDAFVLCASLVVATWRFLALHARISPRTAPDLAALRALPPPYPGPVGWWNWWDQGWYCRAAVAWAHGITDAAMHWYLPGYPLLGAPFARSFPADPFLVPDLACLLASLTLCALLARRLLDAGRGSTALGCAAFLVTVVAPATTMRDWTVPWSTTPEAFGFLGALLAVIGIEDARRPGWRAALAGFAAGAVMGFRPADGAILLVVVAGGLLASAPRRVAILSAAGAGAAVPLLVVGCAYLAVWGPHPSPYLVVSGRVGFEFRLLPLRWVGLMIDPNPVYPRGRGLAEGFLWVAPGMAGLVGATVAPGRSGRTSQLVVGIAVLADLLLFLCYRDLHPDGIWLFGLHHYFAALLPVFALYAVRFGLQITRIASRAEDRAAVLAGMAAVVALFSWHIELRPWVPLQWGSGNSVVLPEGLQPIEAVAMIPGRSTASMPLVLAEGRTASGRVLEIADDMTVPDPGGSSPVLPLLPLRRLPATRTEVRIVSPVDLHRSERPILFKQVIRWGLPAGWCSRLGPLLYH